MNGEKTKAAIRQTLRGMAALFLVLACLLTAGSAGALAAAPDAGTIPAASESFYVYDGADVLSPETEASLVEAGQRLNESHQAQIVVMTLHTIPGDSAADRVSYADQVIKSWNIGGASKTGLLLLLSVDDGDYWAVAGESLKPLFTNSVLKQLLNDQLETDFAAKAYDAGVTKFYNTAVQKTGPYLNEVRAAAAAAASEAALSEASQSSEAETQDEKEPVTAPQDSEKKPAGSKGVLVKILKILGLVLVVVLVLILLFFVYAVVQRRSRRRKRTVHSGSRRRASSRTSIASLPPRYHQGTTRRRYR